MVIVYFKMMTTMTTNKDGEGSSNRKKNCFHSFYLVCLKRLSIKMIVNFTNNVNGRV